MGLSPFPSPAEGVLPVLVVNTVLSVTLLKSMLRSVLHVMRAGWNAENMEEEPLSEGYSTPMSENGKERRVSITQFKSLCDERSGVARIGSSGSSGTASGWALVECCVCLCGFEAEEEVIELSCNHFFHKCCLEKWFDNKHSTCPLCRSVE